MTRLFSVEGSGAWYAKSLSHLGPVETEMKEFASSPESFDVVLFTGGEDVHPGIYGQRHYSRQGSTMFQRDMKEAYVYQVAKRFGIPMAGICRGLQFTASMAGASLVQDFSSHPGDHSNTPIVATYPSGKKAVISGLCMHHQMVDCNTLTPNMQVVGYVDMDGAENHFPNYTGDGGKKIHQNIEIEAVFCTDPLIFGVQYHPESMPPKSSGRRFFCEWVEYMLDFKRRQTGELKQNVAHG